MRACAPMREAAVGRAVAIDGASGSPVVHDDLDEPTRGPVDPGGAGTVRRGRASCTRPGLERYVDWMAGQPIGGVAVWAHTGRGLLLQRRRGAIVFSAWRRALPAGSRPDRGRRRAARSAKISDEVFAARPRDGPPGGRPRGRCAARPPPRRLPRRRRPRCAHPRLPLPNRRGRLAADRILPL